MRLNLTVIGEGLSAWTGRDLKVADTRQHAGRMGVHHATVVRIVGAPRIDRFDVTDFGNPN